MTLAIFNNRGLGNGIIIFPLLRELGKLGIPYYHIANDFLYAKKEQLSCLDGFMPSIWRRFQDTQALSDFFKEKKVSTVLNARKEDGRIDLDYFAFKNSNSGTGIKFYDLHDPSINNDLPIAKQLETMICQFAPDLHPNWRWLQQNASPAFDVTIYIGGSTKSKMLALEQTLNLYQSIREEDSSQRIMIASGCLDYEQRYIESMQKLLGNDHNTTFQSLDNLENSETLVKNSRTIFTTDTYMSHLAGAATDLTFTVFTYTNGIIWRSALQPLSNIFQSQIPLMCESMKNDRTCSKFYSSCGLCSGQDLDFKLIGKRVYKAAQKQTEQ